MTDADHHLPLSASINLVELEPMLADPWAASDYLKDRGATLTDLLVLYARDLSAPRPFRVVEAEFDRLVFLHFCGTTMPDGRPWNHGQSWDEESKDKIIVKESFLDRFSDRYSLVAEHSVLVPSLDNNAEMKQRLRRKADELRRHPLMPCGQWQLQQDMEGRRVIFRQRLKPIDFLPPPQVAELVRARAVEHAVTHGMIDLRYSRGRSIVQHPGLPGDQACRRVICQHDDGRSPWGLDLTMNPLLLLREVYLRAIDLLITDRSTARVWIGQCGTCGLIHRAETMMHAFLFDTRDYQPGDMRYIINEFGPRHVTP